MALATKPNLKALLSLLSLVIVFDFQLRSQFVHAETPTQLPYRQYSETFTRSDSDTLFELSHKWIRADSVRVSKNDSWLEPLRDYRILSPGHIVWIYTPLTSNDTIVVTYSYTPISLLRSYSRRSLRELTRYDEQIDSVGIPIARQSEPSASSWTSLRRNGSLVRSVQIGSNQDLAFESALSLQIEGKVGNNVEVVAALSDQDLPIQAEGTTESIRELDKVYVTIKSPNFDATIGDYEFELEGRRYDAYSRKLSGLKLGARSRNATAIVSAAISRGEFQTNRFAGVESVQGPYQLSGKNGETGIIVLAGTETVWLDGYVLRRGESNDYTIDYAAGQISFSSRHLMTIDTRIVVEFEYANEDYERQYWAARSGINIEKSVAGGFVTYITERDDRSRPLAFTLDEADRGTLIVSGDSATFAFSNTADSLGPGRGDYFRIDSLIGGLSISLFVYVPPTLDGAPQGEWQVFFDDFGVSQGDYQATADEFGRTYFYFVGIGLGRFRAARRVPLPTSRDLLAFRLDRHTTSGLRSNVEVAMSNFDRNTFSELDDSDNQGLASAVEIGYNRPTLEIAGITLRQISAGAEGRVREKTFSDIARSDAIEFDREWAASSVREATEIVGQTNLGFAPVSAISMTGSAGILSREEAFRSNRYNVTGFFQVNKSSSLRGEHTAIQSKDSVFSRDTDWIRQKFEGSTKWKIVSPRFVVNRERQLRDSRIGQDGFRFMDGSIGNLIEMSRSISLDVAAGLRQDDGRSFDKKFVRASEAVSYSSELRWLPLDLGRGVLRWVHREKTFASVDSSSVTSDAGRMDLLLTPRNRVVELNMLYEALKSRTEEQLQIFVPTTIGTGSYRLENGVYIPDDQGDYELVTRNTGSFEPTSEIRTSATLWLKPDETRSATRILWHQFAFETEATLEEQTRSPFTIGLLFLDRSKVLSIETIDGQFSLRQDVHFNRLSRDLSFRLRGRNSASQISRFANGSQQLIRRESSLRGRVRYNKRFRGETEVSTDLERSIYEGVSIASTDVTRQIVQHDVVWSISDRIEVGLKGTAGESKDERSFTQASLREIAPRASYTSFRKGRADAEFQWAHVNSNRARLPQGLAGGSNRGENFRWSFRVTIALSENFTSSLNYSGRRDSGEDTVNIGRVEVRATF